MPKISTTPRRVLAPIHHHLWQLLGHHGTLLSSQLPTSHLLTFSAADAVESADPTPWRGACAVGGGCGDWLNAGTGGANGNWILGLCIIWRAPPWGKGIPVTQGCCSACTTPHGDTRILSVNKPAILVKYQISYVRNAVAGIGIWVHQASHKVLGSIRHL